MASYNYLDKGNADGTIFGQSSTTKLGFWGITPADQPAALTTALTTITYTTCSATLTAVITITAAITAGGGFLITDEAQSFLLAVQNIQTRLAEIETNLVEVGIIAGGTATSETDTKYDFIGTGNDADGMILGSASTTKIGFYGITPCDQPAALTAAAPTITCTATVSVLDYTITTLVSASAGFGFTQDSWATLFYVVSNLQTRVAAVSTGLAEMGLIAGGTELDPTAATAHEYDYLDKGNNDGTIFGKHSTTKIGFWGATPADQPSALTTAATTITCTAPGTTDYAIADTLTTIATFKFVTLTAAQTLLYVVQNAQTRMAELETAIEEIGLVASN